MDIPNWYEIKDVHKPHNSFQQLDKLSEKNYMKNYW